jgi:hypothetical protein
MPNSIFIRSPLLLIGAFCVGVAGLEAPADEQAKSDRAVKPVPLDAPFQAYWISGTKDLSDVGYERLLVTHGPLESLSGHTRWSTLPFDNMAMTFETYQRDSLWDKPFTVVSKIGVVDAAAKTAEIEDQSVRYEPCTLDEVVRLLEKPLGTKPIHRRVNPLQSAGQTARAFRLLLLDQMKQARSETSE